MKKAIIILTLLTLLTACSTTQEVFNPKPEPESTEPESSQQESKAQESSESSTQTSDSNEQTHPPFTLEFSSFDGGGPEYTILLDDPSIVTYDKSIVYDSPDHEKQNGSGYDVIFTFTGLKEGETQMTIQKRSPIAEGSDTIYWVTVDKDLNVDIQYLTTEDLDKAVQVTPVLVIDAGDREFYANLEDNESAEAFLQKLGEEGQITVELHDYGNFEKVGPLPWDLPRSDEEITTKPGDIILYQGNQITIYYDQNTWTFTKLATIEDVTREELLEVFGPEETTVTFWIEWSE